MKKSFDVLNGPDVPPLGGVLEFMRMLWQLDHALQATSKRMLASRGITGPQRLVLRLVARFPGISAGRLAKILHVHPSTLTGVLSRLERRRLVTRWLDPKDARRSLFGLTPAGQKLNELKDGTVESAVEQAISSLPPEKMQAAQEVLHALIGALSAQEQRRADR